MSTEKTQARLPSAVADIVFVARSGAAPRHIAGRSMRMLRLAVSLAAILVGAASGPFARAATYTWTQTATGTWNWSTTTNWGGGVVPATSGDSIWFQPPAAGTSPVTSTIDSAWSSTGSVSGLTFLAGSQTLANSGTFTIAPGAGVTSFSIGAGGIQNSNGRNPIAFTGPVTLSANQSWTFVRPVLQAADLNSGTNYQPRINVSGTVNGSAANTTLTLNGGPAYTDLTTDASAHVRSYNVQLSGASGAFGGNIGQLNLKGSFVRLGESAADSNFNRVGDSTRIASSGGGLFVWRQGNGTENLGELRLDAGAFNVYGNVTSGSGTSIYKFASLGSRSNEATLRLSSGVSTADQINFQFADVTGFGSGVNGIVGGWAVARTQQSGLRFLAPPTANTTLTTVVGVTGSTAAQLSGFADTDNVTLALTTGTLTMASSRTINSLRLGAKTFDLGGNTLRIATGGMIYEQMSGIVSGQLTIQNGTLTAGTAADTAGTLYIQQGDTNLAVTNTFKIADNGTGVVNVVYAGDGRLGTSTATSTNSTYTGFTGIYNASVSIGNDNSTAGAPSRFGTYPATLVADRLRISGGSFVSGVSANDAIHANNGISLAGAGVTFRSGGGTFTINSPISGEGQVNVTAGPTVVLAGTASNTYAGSTIVANATGAAVALGLNKTNSATAVPGDLFISARDGSTGDVIVRLDQSDQIANTSVVTLVRPLETGAGTGVPRFRLNGKNEAIAGLMGVAVASPSTSLIVENGTTTSSTLTLMPGSGAFYDYQGVVVNGSTGALHVVVNGNAAGGQAFGGVNTYTGTTSILGGRLTLNSGGSINNSARVVLNGSGAELKYNSATALTAPITFTQGTISGTGSVSASGGVTIGSNAIISPGNSPGIQAYTTGLTLGPGGTYIWEINDWNGSPGNLTSGYDQIQVSGTALNVNATVGSPFTIQITSLTAGNVGGNVPNFDGLTSKTFTIATADLAGGGVTNFASNLFVLGTSSFTNTIPAGGAWSLTNTSTTVLLNYTYTAPYVATTYTLTGSAAASAIHVGGTTSITAVVTNTGTGSADSLAVTGLGVTVSPSGSVTILPTSGTATNTNGTVSGSGNFTTATAGAYTFTPTVTSATNVNLGTSGTLTSTGTATVSVYNLAAANVISGTVNFGTVLKNTVLSSTLSISNTAPTGSYTEKLDAAFGSPTGLASGSGSISLLAAGGGTSTAMTVHLASGSAGAPTGSLPVNCTSNGDGNGLGTTSLTSQTVSLMATVLDPAVASFASGSTTTSWTVNVGTFNQSTGSHTAGFDIYNILQTSGFTADLALVNIIGGTSNTGDLATSLGQWSTVLPNNLVAGGTSSWLATLFTDNLGSFTNTYTLQFQSANGATAFGSDPYQNLTLTVTGSVVVVPEPSTLALAAMSLTIGVWASRRRPRSRRPVRDV